MKKKTVYYVASALLLAVGIAGFASAKSEPTKGLIPQDAYDADRRIRLDRVPDYIVAYTRTGEIAGYVRKDELFGENNKHHEAPVVVVDETLKKPVGRMVPGRGFVPAGVPDEAIPLAVEEPDSEQAQ